MFTVHESGSRKEFSLVHEKRLTGLLETCGGRIGPKRNVKTSGENPGENLSQEMEGTLDRANPTLLASSTLLSSQENL